MLGSVWLFGSRMRSFWKGSRLWRNLKHGWEDNIPTHSHHSAKKARCSLGEIGDWVCFCSGGGDSEGLRGCNAYPCEVLTVHCSLLFKCCDWVCSHFMMRMKCDFRNQLEGCWIKPTVFIFLEILHSLTASKTHLPKTRISHRQIYERVGVWVLSSLVPVLASGRK